MKIDKKNTSVHTWDTHAFDLENDNLYETVVALSKRACQIAAKQKEELYSRLAEFSSHHDGIDEIHENREQIEFSRYYEKQPKPSLQAIFEFLEGEYTIQCEGREYRPYLDVKLEREKKDKEKEKEKEIIKKSSKK
ncbi:MAG: DNA-directed RNA polymerase subunit omega [Bacteroidia bacterium]|nr:DNA-directed RNA polymerase subunit omega [Bacteroidia bacterium]MDW8348287.1 hypothetical protein [Bacteroidia bacterium]